MPELPEVHTTATKLDKLIKGLIISDVWTDYHSPLFEGKKQIKNKKYFDQFKKDVVGAKVISVTRRAKNVLINLSNPKAPLGHDRKTILVHMKMTGHLLFGKYKKQMPSHNRQLTTNNKWSKEVWIPDEKESSPLWDTYNRFIHLVFSFSNGKNLILSDVRKFAKVVVEDTGTIANTKHLGDLGPEPLEKDFTLGVFKERLAQKPDWPIKLDLMNQELIAGIGNIYSDEMLWRANIHPLEPVQNILPTKLKLLFTAMKETLSSGIDFGGDSMSDYRQPDGSAGEFQNKHMAYKRKDVPCLKKGCGGMMKRIVVSSRSAHFCDRHQKKLKD